MECLNVQREELVIFYTCLKILKMNTMLRVRRGGLKDKMDKNLAREKAVGEAKTSLLLNYLYCLFND